MISCDINDVLSPYLGQMKQLKKLQLCKHLHNKEDCGLTDNGVIPLVQLQNLSDLKLSIE
jgi:hypothetical protein